MKNIFKYASYISCVTAIFISSKPVFFYVKGFIIQNKLEYEWTQTIKNKKININDNLIYPIGRINIAIGNNKFLKLFTSLTLVL